jgi:antitoxin (DNA-binding transcriptional repressor) of toxin-antitoxin stability system
MKTASVRELRNDFSRISKWLARGQTVEILKRGKPVADLVPKAKAKSFLGAGQGTAKMSPDFDEPLNLEWDAMK